MQLRCVVCGTELNNPPNLGKDYFTKCPNPNCRIWLCFNSQEQNLKEIKSLSLSPNSRTQYAFFSHSFREVDRGINETFKWLLALFNIFPSTTKHDIRSRDKIQKAREGIKESNFVFIVMPRRYQCCDEESRNNLWKSSEWIQNEIGIAYAYERDIITVREEGVKDEGMLEDLSWCYSFNRDRLVIPWIEYNKMRTPEEAKNELLDTLDAISRM